MACVIQIPELVSEICGHICPGPESDDLNEWYLPDEEKSSTLLNLALACRGSCHAALDRLWWGMDDLTPLFMLIPGFSVGPPGFFTSNLDSATDFTRFDLYASRIRYYNCVKREKILPAAYFQLIRARSYQALLPGLRYVYSQVASPELHLLLSDSLRTLYIRNIHTPGTSHTTVLAWTSIYALPAVAPKLEILELGKEIYVTADIVDTISVMQHLKQLRLMSETLSIEDHILDTADLIKLGKIATLTHLVLNGGLHFFDEPPSEMMNPLFPALEHLEIHADVANIISDVNKLLALLGRRKRLRQLSLMADSNIVTSTLYRTRLQEGLKSLFRFLRRNTVSFSSIFISVPKLHAPIQPAHFTDLLALRLTKLEMPEKFFDTLRHEDFVLIADTWPNLEVLRIDAKRWLTDFHTLIHLAEKLPHLQELYLALRVRRLPNPRDVPKLLHPLQMLQIVTVDHSAEPPSLFGELLSNIFLSSGLSCENSEGRQSDWERQVIKSSETHWRHR
ncbi:hypothetical protein CVT26_009090 [Gymnopilus dilepis]|uniref:F-box domain-containing protein n=1 Tax=Gymnopilus dilepis TaxID=231916 RepID=A0A409WUD7_9AGAR|nr:hypothetical protein CVT26_009090 [Gymnopilus dilepis]